MTPDRKQTHCGDRRRKNRECKEVVTGRKGRKSSWIVNQLGLFHRCVDEPT